MNVTPTSPESSIRATKRKLDDAFHSLDDAVTPRPESKRPHASTSKTTSSIYSTLVKYGIKAKEPSTSVMNDEFAKSTPNLTRILSRAATRTKSAFKSPSTTASFHSSSAGIEYRPSSLPSFLDRLSTFKLANYNNKPSEVNAVAASKSGWKNEGKDRLVCSLCGVSWVVKGPEGLNRDAANSLAEKQKVQLVEMHKNGCPWKSRQCEDSIYRLPLNSPSRMLQELCENASHIDPVLQNVQVKHPLTANQVATLTNVVKTFRISNEKTAEDIASENSLLTSLFGWSLVPQKARHTPAIRRTSSSISVTPFSSLSRSASVAPGDSISRSATPVPSLPTPGLLGVATERLRKDSTSDLVECRLCQRKVGLWAFREVEGSKRRQFDLLKEHRSYCPFVVKSTVVSTLPGVSGGHAKSNSGSNLSSIFGGSHSRASIEDTMSMEGWRAVFTVVGRYGLAARRRMSGLERLVSTPESGGAEIVEEDDPVGAMVKGVKARGGRELLKYVKGLLG